MLLAARASRVENQDAIDACIVGMLGDPKEVQNLVSLADTFHVSLLSTYSNVLTLGFVGESRHH